MGVGGVLISLTLAVDKPRMASATPDHGTSTKPITRLQRVQNALAKPITRLQRVQNALARVVIPNRPPGSSSLHLLKQLHWLLVEWRIKFKIATLTFKALETGQSPYLAQQLCAYAPTRALRSSTSKLLQVPRTNNLRFGSCSFCASAPTLWNSLPRSVRF